MNTQLSTVGPRVLLACIAVTSLAPAAFADSIRIHGDTMGTTYRVDVPRPPAAVTVERLQHDVAGVLADVDRELSTYRPDSELSRFNASASTDWIDVSPGTYQAVAVALDVSRLCGGAFDITVGPLVDLWGFGPDKGIRRQPSPQSLRAAMEQTGYEHIEVRAQPPALRKALPGIRLDLGGIGNGYGVDRVIEHLAYVGIQDYLVEIGGELRARGNNRKGRFWTAAVEEPGGRGDAALAVVRLDSHAIATSSSSRNYFDEAGTRYSHIVDPRRGVPIRHSLISVSVVDPSATRADALATALLVLGPDEGPALARRTGLAALFVIGDGTRLRQLRTPGFARLEVS